MPTLTLNYTNNEASEADFDLFAPLSPNVGNIVAQDDVLEMRQEHLKLVVKNPSGFSTSNVRDLKVTMDYGERYDMPYDETDAYLSNTTCRRPMGNTLGLYYGYAVGHTMEGRDLSKNQVLTSTYNGTAGPEGTMDITVSVTVSDGSTSKEKTFTARVTHSDKFYTDKNGATYCTDYPGTRRGGIVFISRDGIFTDALTPQEESGGTAGIYHMTISDGVIDWTQFFHGTPSGPTLTDGTNDFFAWSSGSEDPSLSIRLKAGETFYLKDAKSTPGNVSDVCLEIDTWTHTGSSTPAILTVEEETKLWDDADVNDYALFFQNGSNPSDRYIFRNIDAKGSDYTPSDSEWTEWWNKLPYTGKSGTFTVNTSSDGWNGEILDDNASGVFTQIIRDTGSELWVRQIVDNSDVDLITASPATFTNGDTLRGLSSGATATFSDTGDVRQARTKRAPLEGFIKFNNVEDITVHRCIVRGHASGIARIGSDAGITCCRVADNWNYGMQATGGTVDDIRASLTGTLFIQRDDFAGTPRDFGGAVKSGNRNNWNQPQDDDPDMPARNDISHSAMRFKTLDDFSMHQCIVHWYGGHGNQHQPTMRFATDGMTAEGKGGFVIMGNDIIGGGRPINNSLANDDPTIYIYTPVAINIERNNLVATYANERGFFYTSTTNFMFRNNILEYPSGVTIDFGTTGDRGTEFLREEDTATSDVTFVDTNAVSPVVEFNTFISESSFTGDASGLDGYDLLANPTAIRATSITYRNNAVHVEEAKFPVVASEFTSINDHASPSDFSADWEPTSDATNAYQTATGTIPDVDFDGDARPGSNVSKGAQEPA